MWLGLRQSGKQGSTSGQAMSMALDQAISPTASMAQMGLLSTITWALRILFLSLLSLTRLVSWETTHQSLNFLCNPLNFGLTMWPAIQVYTAKLHPLHLPAGGVKTGRGKTRSQSAKT